MVEKIIFLVEKILNLISKPITSIHRSIQLFTHRSFEKSLTMKELYSQWLRIQCESWMKESLPELFQGYYKRAKKLVVAQEENAGVEEECLLSQIDVSVGPWLGVYFHFKEPGERICPLEKCSLSQLREHGNLVLIVRCVEDFKTLMQNYFYSYINSSVLSYAAKSA